MSTKTTPTAADLRAARTSACLTAAEQTATSELGNEANRDVSVTSTLSATVTNGTKTRTAAVKATVALSSEESETDSAAK